ncbi:hypothetical protein AGOR_G00018430 [Albula goreensis]|uniref:THAP domain-containing protein 1 n=1 Tax=Albula goreensis TaxID=1534307 RepID=A0A8T3E065_9TELE|nr:hypothetical protein AGOR_G00018430 [Albula goreensis]
MKMTSKAGHVSCAVDGCKAVQKSLHSLPKDGNLRNAWLEFIFNHKVPLHVSPHLCVCSAHFSSDCMENQARYAAGFAKKLILRPGAIPTIWDPTTVKIEQCNYTSKPTPRDVACQTDPPQRKSVGTQLSWSLQQHFRSRGFPSRSPGARDDEEAPHLMLKIKI